MSLTPGTFRPEEINGADPPIREGDLSQALAAAHSLEQAMPSDSVRSSSGFANRVMAAVAVEPAPRSAWFFAGVLAHPGLASLAGSVRGAWSTAAGRADRPFGVRAAALAYVFVVLIAAVSVTGAAALGAAGAFGFLSDDGSPVPSEVVASPSPDQTDGIGPWASPEPSESAEPSESTGPNGSREPDGSLEADATPTSRPSTRPSASPSPVASDDHGETPSPSSSGDSAGSGSRSPTDSARPSDTPKPSETPH